MKTFTTFTVLAMASAAAAAGPVGLTNNNKGSIIAARASSSEPSTSQEHERSPHVASPYPPLPYTDASQFQKDPHLAEPLPRTRMPESERASWLFRLSQVWPRVLTGHKPSGVKTDKSNGGPSLQRRTPGGALSSVYSSLHQYYYQQPDTPPPGEQQLARLPPPPEEPQVKEKRVGRLTGLPEEIDQMDKDAVLAWCVEACQKDVFAQLSSQGENTELIDERQSKEVCTKVCRDEVEIQDKKLREQAKKDAARAADIDARRAAYDEAARKAFGRT
ncbi:hypothetical protein PspLS_02783 [Pyricularia sp. CBS 133598]|nr:hypothetical protein PspLS_02783 [Pyricularia sp. CBS 133598]